uniref:Putative radical SAM superfamily protein n=1 Tax=viral metagenome TaxID=1070528 RepID=A0A6M3K4H4_9ZZZZ
MSIMFSPFNPAKILHYSTEIQNYLKHGKIPNPAMVSFDFANPCNHKCVWCNWTEHRAKEGGFLQEDVFESILADCASMNVTGYEVCGGGEPLVHPFAHEYLAMLNELGRVLLITNGSNLIPEDGMHCETIRVSLDAATAETHRKLHQTNDFEKILNNIKDVAELTRVGLGFLFHPDNYEEIPAFAELGKELGCDFVQIRPCFTDYPIIRDTIGYDYFEWINNKFGISPITNGEAIERYINTARQEYEDEDFKVYSTVYKTEPKRDWTIEHCIASLFNPMVTPSGAVWICCERRGVEGSLIGTVGIDGTFKDLWLGDRHKELISVCPNNLCPAKDKYLGYNKVIDAAYIKQTMDLDWI